MTVKLSWYERLCFWLLGPIEPASLEDCKPPNGGAKMWHEDIQTIPTRDLAGKTHHVPVKILMDAQGQAERYDKPCVVSRHGSRLFYVFPFHWTNERCRNYDKLYPIYKVPKEDIKMIQNQSTSLILGEKLSDAVKRAQRIADGRNQPVRVKQRKGPDMYEDKRTVYPSGWSDTTIRHNNGHSSHTIFMGEDAPQEAQYVDLPHSIGEGQAIAKALSKPIEVVGQNLQGPFDQNVQAVHVYDTDEGPVLTIWVPHKGHHFVKRGKDGEYIPGRQRDAEVLKEYVRAL